MCTLRYTTLCLLIGTFLAPHVGANDGYYTHGYSPGHRAGAFYGNGPERFGRYHEPGYRGHGGYRYGHDRYRRNDRFSGDDYYGYAPAERRRDYDSRRDHYDRDNHYRHRQPSRNYNPNYYGYRDGRRSHGDKNYRYRRPRQSIVQPQRDNFRSRDRAGNGRGEYNDHRGRIDYERPSARLHYER